MGIARLRQWRDSADLDKPEAQRCEPIHRTGIFVQSRRETDGVRKVNAHYLYGALH